jgi:uncharacterized membrane protein
MDVLSMVLVGAFWGCTNPLLRKGALEAQKSGSNFITKFLNVRVWLPYVLNQCGSILFYFLLAKSELSLAVPTCNALSLVFSCITSFMLGEPVNQPVRTILGAALVVAGVAVCLTSTGVSQQAGVDEKEL